VIQEKHSHFITIKVQNLALFEKPILPVFAAASGK
jgi:hypothetical protein